MKGDPVVPVQLKAWTYVFIQALLIFLLVFLGSGFGPQIHRIVLPGRALEMVGVLGVLICAASLRSSLTVVPIPKDEGRLSTTGLYRYVRHPMYTSVLLLASGIALQSGSITKYLLVILLTVLFYSKSVFEEQHLRMKYPEYADYSTRIPRFIPFTK